MAKSKNNVVTHGLSGLIGDLLVFRQRANKTIVADRPRAFSKPPTAIQLEIRQHFKRAVQYAKTALIDPILKAAYQAMTKLGQTAFNTAFADYQRAPEFDAEVSLESYSGAVGEEITVSVLDDFRVTSVRVEIRNADGSLLEEGEAVQSENGPAWVYTTTMFNSELPGTTIMFTASDLPGNRTVLEKTFV